LKLQSGLGQGETQHGSGSAFYKPVILLNNIVRVFTLTDLYTFVFIEFVLFDGGCIGSAFVDIYQAGFAAEPANFATKPFLPRDDSDFISGSV
jgi:hypothetical protein